MRKLPPGFAALLLVWAANAFAAEEPEQQRPIRPTEAELESFELPPPEMPEAQVDVPTTGSTAFEISGVGLFAASAADFATTEWGLSRGLQEGNPVASQRGIRVVHHIVGPAAVFWTSDRLQRSGRPKLALGLRIALMAAYSYATVHNLRQVGELPSVP